MQDVKHQLGDWQQREPMIGEFPIPGCEKCGAGWTDGMCYHFEDGWRDPYGHRAAKVSRIIKGRG